MEFAVISIGTLSENPFWQERSPVRTSHATTTFINNGNKVIIIDPSLPAQALEQRIFERTGLKSTAVTDIFLTNWRPVHRRALSAFPNATWWMWEREIEAAREALSAAQSHAERHADDITILKDEETLMENVEPAPDKLTDGVSIFPLPGYSPGQCGLLLELPTTTIVIAGDAVPTAAHFTNGRVLPDSFDIKQAQESLAELYNLADQIVPGHDNIFINPRSAGF